MVRYGWVVAGIFARRVGCLEDKGGVVAVINSGEVGWSEMGEGKAGKELNTKGMCHGSVKR